MLVNAGCAIVLSCYRAIVLLCCRASQPEPYCSDANIVTSYQVEARTSSSFLEQQGNLLRGNNTCTYRNAKSRVVAVELNEHLKSIHFISATAQPVRSTIRLYARHSPHRDTTRLCTENGNRRIEQAQNTGRV